MAIKTDWIPIFKEAYKELIGAEDLDTFSLKDVIDAATAGKVRGFDVITTLAEKINMTIPVGNDGTYKGKLTDLFAVTREEYGAAIETYDVIPVEVSENPSYSAIISGTTVLHDTPVYLCTVKSQVYAKGVAYAFTFGIPQKRSDRAFNNESEMIIFAEWLKGTILNSRAKHREVLLRESLNNFIATKYKYSTLSGAKGIHVVDLNKLYCEFTGGTSGETFTTEDFRKDARAQLFAQQMINFYWDDLLDYSVTYNVGGYERFTNEADLVFIANSLFDSDMKRVALADSSYDRAFMDGKKKITLSSWQASKQKDWDHLTRISVKIGFDYTAAGEHSGTETEETVTLSNVCGIILDRRCLMSVIVEDRTGIDYDDIKAITNYSIQNCEKYLNNLTLNSVIFTCNDYEFA